LTHDAVVKSDIRTRIRPRDRKRGSPLIRDVELGPPAHGRQENLVFRQAHGLRIDRVDLDRCRAASQPSRADILEPVLRALDGVELALAEVVGVYESALRSGAYEIGILVDRAKRNIVAAENPEGAELVVVVVEIDEDRIIAIEIE
jgi:hypothetical protein